MGADDLSTMIFHREMGNSSTWIRRGFDSREESPIFTKLGSTNTLDPYFLPSTRPRGTKTILEVAMYCARLARCPTERMRVQLVREQDLE